MLRPLFLLCLLLAGITQIANACSMCKVTIGGRTWVGNNEDSWNTASRVWFETPKRGEIGAVYVGYTDNRFPQGGMNEAGLTFDGLTIRPKHSRAVPGKKRIDNTGEFLKTVLRTCRTVDEVAALAGTCNRSGTLDRGVVFFADRSGRYLVMEPDTLLVGNDPKYIIANFCPSGTAEPERLRFGRYKRGRAFLQQMHSGDGAAFCRALTDTMHECRPGRGDGTLYSTIADLSDGTYSLYFYHDFSRPVTFRLKDELAKGPHSYTIPQLFPPSPEYSRLAAYKTPRNDRAMRMVLLGCAAFCFAAGAAFAAGLVWNTAKRHSSKRAGLYAMAALLGFGAVYYSYILLTNEAVYYFPAPYKAPGSAVISTFSYFPFALLILTPLLAGWAIRTAKTGSRFSGFLLGAGGLVATTLLVLFGYWGLLRI